MIRVITISLLIARVCVHALPRFIWFELVGNIYDLAFTAKLTLIWSQPLIYDLPALINIQLQLKMQHLHFAVSAFAQYESICILICYVYTFYSRIVCFLPLPPFPRLFYFEVRVLKRQIFTIFLYILNILFCILLYFIFPSECNECLSKLLIRNFLRVDKVLTRSHKINLRLKFLSTFVRHW